MVACLFNKHIQSEEERSLLRDCSHCLSRKQWRCTGDGGILPQYVLNGRFYSALGHNKDHILGESVAAVNVKQIQAQKVWFVLIFFQMSLGDERQDRVILSQEESSCWPCIMR